MTWTSETVLTAIGEHAPNECVTESRLMELTELEERQVERACDLLRKHELIEKVGPGCHQLTDAGREALANSLKICSGPNGPRIGGIKVPSNTLRERVWRAIRLRRKFTLPDLIALVAEGDERDVESNIRKYVNALTRAHILVELPRREAGTALTSNGYKRWWLMDDRDPGPKAPIWRARANSVYDPNNEKEIDLEQLAANAG